MKYYAEVGFNLQMVDDAEFGCPEGWIEMFAPRPEDENTLDYTAQIDGTWKITQETLNAKLAPVENAWRNNEMSIAKNNVTAIEFGDDDIKGTSSEWKAYWLVLRKWTDANPDFPDSTKRPVSPE